MTYIKKLTAHKAASTSKITMVMLVGVLLVLLLSSTVQAQWTTNGNNINNTNSGNVGVGTTSPGYALDVQQNTTNNASGTVLRLKGNTAGTNDNTQLRFGGKTNGDLFTIGTDITTNNGTRAFQLYDLVAAAARFTVDATGNVGIGTFSPGGRLDIQRGDGSDLLVRAWNSATASGAAIFRAAASSGGNEAARLELTDNAGYNGGISGDHTNGLIFKTGNQSSSYAAMGTRMTITPGGNVGIGTTSPGEFVHIRKDQNAATHLVVENTTAGASAYADLQVKNNLGNFAQFGLYSSTTATAGALASGNAFTYTTSPAMVIMANNAAGVIKFATGGLTEQARIDASGNVGIGTATPAAKLDVNGNVRVTGNITATGNIAAKYQDVAEWVESSQALPAGTVVVLDHTKSNQVIASTQAYDTRVAGVISAQPGITLGEKGESKVLVATTGRVKVKVDASAGPIQVGDLLVTSDIKGMAKKSEPLNLGGVEIHRPGTLIGKALEPLKSGTGEILVLLSLQ